MLSVKTDAPAEVKAALLAATADGNGAALRIEALQLMAQTDPANALVVAQRFLEVKGAQVAEKQAAVRVIFGSAAPDAAPLRDALVGKLAQPKFDASIRLDVFLAAQARNDPALQPALLQYQNAARPAAELAAPGLPYVLLTAGGDPERGRTITQEHLAANCVACHRFEADEGSEVGPWLKKVGEQRTPAELAESLVNPSAKIVPGFGIETITMRSGEVFSGSVVSETLSTLKVRLPDGVIKDLPVAAVANRTQPVSIMPPMLGILTPAEVRDVVAYLATLKSKAPKAKK